MSRFVTVATLHYSNHPNDVRKGPERVREIWELLMDRAALDRPDIFLLPETFMSGGLELPREAVPGEGFVQDLLARKARQYNMYIAAGLDRIEPETGRLFNSAVLFDRSGNVAGIYDKLFPTPGEMERSNITPGDQPKVFDTDFGRIGIAICFDLNFREVFRFYREQRVELCCFLSQMSGGAHLPSLARDGRMFMASSVCNDGAYIINPIGAVVRDTSACGNQRVITARINLDYQVYHILPLDMRERKEQFPVLLKKKYGDRIRWEAASNEPYKMVVSDCEELSAADVLREFNVDSVDETLERTRSMRRARQAKEF